MMRATLDAPGTACHFQSHGCTRLVAGLGGFDQHHPIPVELGGDPNQPLLPLCPIHHRRQHALIRYLVEQIDVGPKPAVMLHFTVAELAAAIAAVAHWNSTGRRTINGWPCPAAREGTR